MERLKSKIIEHIFVSWWVYLLVGSFFFAGLFFGILGVNALDQKQSSSLTAIFDNGMNQLKDNVDLSTNARQSAVKNIFNLGKIFILGLTVIGLPLILIIIFTRGFALGFTIGFLIKEKAWQGCLMTLLAVLPPNLLSLPVYILGAVTAINFSIFLIRGSKNIRLPQYLFEYIIVTVCLGLVLLGSALIEGYLSPVFIKFVI